MRMMMELSFPTKAFNESMKKGTSGERLQRILDAQKPEAIYFRAKDGQRGAVLVVDVTDSSQLPALAEPWFLEFEASIEVSMCMSPEDLGASGLDDMGKTWG